MSAGVIISEQIRLVDLYRESLRLEISITDLITLLIKNTNLIKAQGEDAHIENGSPCFRLILEEASKGEVHETINYRLVLALRAIGADPDYAGYIKEKSGLRKRTTALQMVKDAPRKGSYLIMLLHVLRAEPKALPSSLQMALPYDILRTQIYLNIQAIERYKDTNSQEKAALLRSAMKALDKCYNPKASMHENFAILARALEDESSDLVSALKKRRLVRTDFTQTIIDLFTGNSASHTTASYDAVKQFKDDLQMLIDKGSRAIVGTTTVPFASISRSNSIIASSSDAVDDDNDAVAIVVPFANIATKPPRITLSDKKSDAADNEVAGIFGVKP